MYVEWLSVEKLQCIHKTNVWTVTDLEHYYYALGLYAPGQQFLSCRTHILVVLHDLDKLLRIFLVYFQNIPNMYECSFEHRSMRVLFESVRQRKIAKYANPYQSSYNNLMDSHLKQLRNRKFIVRAMKNEDMVKSVDTCMFVGRTSFFASLVLLFLCGYWNSVVSIVNIWIT